MSDDVKVPLPIPDDSNEWSAPLWDEDSLRAHGRAVERAAREAEREAILAAILRLPSPGPELSDGYVSGHHWGRAGAIDVINARSAAFKD